MQSWSEVPWRHRLFDSLLVFQNYLVDESARRLGPRVEIQDFKGPLHTNYPLTLLVTPDSGLQLGLFYQPELFEAGTAKCLLEDVLRLLNAFGDAAAENVSGLLKLLSAPAATAGPRVAARRPSSRNFVAPLTETEKAIAKVWREAFGVDEVGIQDNFFDLGGHSLLIVQVHRQLCAALKSDILIVALFQYPTIAALAKHLTQKGGETPALQQAMDRAQKQREALARRRISAKR